MTHSLKLLNNLSEAGVGMVMETVISVICLGCMRRKKSFTLIIAPSLLRLLQNRFQLQFGFHFLEDQAKLIQRTQYEMNLGDGGRYCSFT